MNIKKGDTVKVLYGKDAGKTGNVLASLLKKGKVLVSGVNKVKRHLKGDGKTRKSEIIEIERPMSVSKVMLVCQECGKTTRIKIERKGSGYVRICKKCGKEISKVKAEVKKEEVKKTVKKVSKKTTKK